MAEVIYRGSTPTIRMSPTNGMLVSDLGTPTLGISQELVFLNPEVTVNVSENYIQTTLTEAETLQLAENVETEIQQSWAKEDGTVIRFPVHKVEVRSSVVEEITAAQTGETEDVDIPDEVPDGGAVTTDEEEFEEPVPGDGIEIVERIEGE